MMRLQPEDFVGVYNDRAEPEQLAEDLAYSRGGGEPKEAEAKPMFSRRFGIKGRPPLELVGTRYGRLVVVIEAERDFEGRRRWSCLCDCGNTAVVQQLKLRSGARRSCGCARVAALARWKGL